MLPTNRLRRPRPTEAGTVLIMAMTFVLILSFITMAGKPTQFITKIDNFTNDY